MPVRRLAATALAAALVLGTASHAFAWGATGHRIIGQEAIRALPAEIPGFLRTPQAMEQIGELSREADRSRGAGNPHDADLDPGHFIDVGDDGRILGGPAITAMPADRFAYDAALQAVGADPAKAGYLYYTLVDGWQQLVKDFAYWRIDRVGETRAATPEERAWCARDRLLRELIIVRDLGYWSHFVGDASMPLHASVHYNAWGEPNPKGYTREKIHSPFESAFVGKYVTAEAVRAAMPAPEPVGPDIQAYASAYLAHTQTLAEPLFALWTAGEFKDESHARGQAFATEQVAAGAARLRDLIVAAWRASPEATIGYPAVKVSDVEAGRVPFPFDELFGKE